MRNVGDRVKVDVKVFIFFFSIPVQAEAIFNYRFLKIIFNVMSWI